MIRPVLPLCVVVVVSILSACSTGLGPRSVVEDRQGFNKALARTSDEQLLLNLVRLRYNDTPVFLELGSIVAGYTLESRGNVAGTFGINGAFAGSSPEVGSAVISGGLTYSEKPTVTYTPLQGEDFAKRLLTPIPPQVLLALANSGWSIERLLIICSARFGDIPNAPTASGPTPSEAPEFQRFHEAAAAVRRLQQSGVVSIRISREPQGTATAFEVHDPDPADAASQADLERLRAMFQPAVNRDELFLVNVYGPDRVLQLNLQTRSLLGMLYFLSQSVEVPEEELRSGVATRTMTADGKPFDWRGVTGRVMTIHTGTECPKRPAVAVEHRGRWYWIDDCDANSKASFALMHHIFSLQATGGQGRSPLLTIPAG